MLIIGIVFFSRMKKDVGFCQEETGLETGKYQNNTLNCNL